MTIFWVGDYTAYDDPGHCTVVRKSKGGVTLVYNKLKQEYRRLRRADPNLPKEGYHTCPPRPVEAVQGQSHYDSLLQASTLPLKALRRFGDASKETT